MAIEVEQKFPVSPLEAVCDKLAALGGKLGERREEVDRYYAHPARDFARTDEALRIRGVGPAGFLTYKGPKMDATTKTRREIELALPAGDEGRRAWGELLEALGFRPIAEVRKRRRKARVPWQGRPVELCLDEVEHLGTFVEIELVTEPDDVELAKACIASLAAHLGLANSERRSYLELLLERHP